jgi:hypothetical protein
MSLIVVSERRHLIKLKPLLLSPQGRKEPAFGLNDVFDRRMPMVSYPGARFGYITETTSELLASRCYQNVHQSKDKSRRKNAAVEPEYPVVFCQSPHDSEFYPGLHTLIRRVAQIYRPPWTFSLYFSWTWHSCQGYYLTKFCLAFSRAMGIAL